MTSKKERMNWTSMEFKAMGIQGLLVTVLEAGRKRRKRRENLTLRRRGNRRKLKEPPRRVFKL